MQLAYCESKVRSEAMSRLGNLSAFLKEPTNRAIWMVAGNRCLAVVESHGPMISLSN